MDRKIIDKKYFIDNNLFEDIFKLADPNYIIDRIKETEGESFEIEEGKIYTIYKNFFGVKIESGNIKLIKVVLSQIYDIISYFYIIKKGKKSKKEKNENSKNAQKDNKENKKENNYIFLPKNNKDNILEFIKNYNLENIDFNVIKGYELNNEIVRIKKNGLTCIYLKYKDNPNNIFYLYQIYFTKYKEEYYLVIEKRI